MEIEIRRIAMVIRRQFAIDAVAAYLPLHFIHERARTERPPLNGPGQLREQNTRDEQGSSLSDEMGVRAGVDRRVSMDMIELCKERLAYPAQTGFTQRL